MGGDEAAEQGLMEQLAEGWVGPITRWRPALHCSTVYVRRPQWCCHVAVPLSSVGKTQMVV